MRYLLSCFLIAISLYVCAQNNNGKTEFGSRKNVPTKVITVKETWYEKELRLEAERHARIQRKRTILPANVVQVKEVPTNVKSQEPGNNYVIFKDAIRKSPLGPRNKN